MSGLYHAADMAFDEGPSLTMYCTSAVILCRPTHPTPTMPDLEANIEAIEYLEGYSDLAAFKSSDAQFSVWRRFDRLGAQNLLYYEAEVQHLEFELKTLDEEDKKIIETGNENETVVTDARARCWEALTMQVDQHDQRGLKRIDLIRRLRVAMKEYGEIVVSHVYTFIKQ